MARSRLAVIVESSDDAIISKDLDGNITTWNQGAERLYGYPAEEVIGRPISMLAPSDRVDELPRILDRLKRGERIERYETVRICRDGRRVDVSLSISPMSNGSGKVLGASVIAQDITDRKRAEAAFRFSEQRARAFLDNSAIIEVLRKPSFAPKA